MSSYITHFHTPDKSSEINRRENELHPVEDLSGKVQHVGDVNSHYIFKNNVLASQFLGRITQISVINRRNMPVRPRDSGIL